MMNLRTIIKVSPSQKPISLQDTLCLIGSCFSQSIGGKLENAGLKTDINPFGITYNPISISETIRKTVKNTLIRENDLVYSEPFWHVYSHHGSFRSEDRGELLNQANNRLREGNENIINSNRLILTLGSAWVYEHIQNKWIMGNCHRLPSNVFNKRLLSLEEIIDSLAASIQIFLENTIADSPSVIITVSPVRHWRDGYRENQVSKSLLHVAIDRLMQDFSCIEYFPSYEILFDELRDYRFYERDMLHPSPLAIDYIWKRFKETYFASNHLDYIERHEALTRMKSHRLINPESQESKRFIEKIKALEAELKASQLNA